VTNVDGHDACRFGRLIKKSTGKGVEGDGFGQGRVNP
jgi:hypothetical protein